MPFRMTIRTLILRAGRALPAALLLLTAGCNGGSTPGFNAAQEWGRIQKQGQDLTALRAQEDSLRADLDRWEAAAGDPKAAPVQGLRKGKLREAATAFWDNLTLFLDRVLNDPRLKGSAEAGKAVRLFVDESIALAKDRVREEGRYDQAAEVLQQALRHDPTNAALKMELEKVRAFQRLARDRFDRVRDGMTMPAVRELCGVPSDAAVQERTEKNRTLTAWLFPREDGNWAAVFFQDGRVYDKAWDARPKP
jgi:tetratricopeptide (TPR) repeat protein